MASLYTPLHHFSPLHCSSLALFATMGITTGKPFSLRPCTIWRGSRLLSLPLCHFPRSWALGVVIITRLSPTAAAVTPSMVRAAVVCRLIRHPSVLAEPELPHGFLPFTGHHRPPQPPSSSMVLQCCPILHPSSVTGRLGEPLTVLTYPTPFPSHSRSLDHATAWLAEPGFGLGP
jgi:hypothetical protein